MIISLRFITLISSTLSNTTLHTIGSTTDAITSTKRTKCRFILYTPTASYVTVSAALPLNEFVEVERRINAGFCRSCVSTFSLRLNKENQSEFFGNFFFIVHAQTCTQHRVIMENSYDEMNEDIFVGTKKNSTEFNQDCACTLRVLIWMAIWLETFSFTVFCHAIDKYAHVTLKLFEASFQLFFSVCLSVLRTWINTVLQKNHSLKNANFLLVDCIHYKMYLFVENQFSYLNNRPNF